MIYSQNFAVASDPGYTVAYTGNQLQPGSTLGLTYHFLHPKDADETLMAEIREHPGLNFHDVTKPTVYLTVNKVE